MQVQRLEEGQCRSVSSPLAFYLSKLRFPRSMCVADDSTDSSPTFVPSTSLASPTVSFIPSSITFITMKISTASSVAIIAAFAPSLVYAAVNMGSSRYASLNMAICQLIEDFSLGGFEVLAVEVCHTHSTMTHIDEPFVVLVDRESLLNLMCGRARLGASLHLQQTLMHPSSAVDLSGIPADRRPNVYSLFTTAIGLCLVRGVRCGMCKTDGSMPRRSTMHSIKTGGGCYCQSHVACYSRDITSQAGHKCDTSVLGEGTVPSWMSILTLT